MISIVGTEVEYLAIVECSEPVDPRKIAAMIVRSHPIALAPLGVVSYGNPADGMLSNGARLYDDLGHPEYSTPECRDLFTLVACEKAGERLLQACCQSVSETLPDGWKLSLYKNNTDHAGHTWGGHENYLVSPVFFERLIQRQEHDLVGVLATFLATRQLIGGSGRVGGEGGWTGYQLSQRADFIQTVIGLETTRCRPIINTRDEPHADGTRFRRLHVVLGDTNLSEFALYLKVGTTRLILQVLEDYSLKDLPVLADPVTAMRQISRDPGRLLSMEGGVRYSAADIQSAYAEKILDCLSRATLSLEDQNVISSWGDVIDALKHDLFSLHDRLDWAIKYAFLEDVRQQENIDWSASLIQELDIRYHDIHPDRSLFYKLQNEGFVHRMVDERQIEHHLVHPPEDTRARVRTSSLEQYCDGLSSVDWERMVSKQGRFEWPDPTIN
jgi:proteasome accessory factor A